jgi:hypothetical protein
MPLAVTVEAGENYPDNEAVTLAKLRKGAKPSVAITGTVSAVDIQDGTITGAKIADTQISPAKMGNATITGETNAAFKGVILASGSNSADLDKFDELYAGKRNAFLIGSSTKTGEAWTDEYLVKSKTLHADSSLEVTDQTATDFTIKVKDDGIVRDMMADNSVGSSQISNYSVTINSLSPGGGDSSSGGIASETADFWGGVLDFNPALESGDTGWHGKASALQPTAKNQTLYSTASGERLKFGHHPCIPRAFAKVLQNGGTFGPDGFDASSVATFNVSQCSGIASITQTAVGTYDVVFQDGIYAVGDPVKVFGRGSAYATDPYTAFAHNAANAVAGTGSAVKVVVKFYFMSHNSGTFLSDTRLRNVSEMDLLFF